MIPRILHAFWGGPPMPEDSRGYLDAWARLHPSWEVRVWTPDTIPPLRNQDFYDDPERFSPKSNVWQWRSDLARYEILHDMGGVYVDCDLEPLYPIDGLVDGCEAVAALEDDRMINNAFVGTEPGGPFIADVLAGLRASVLARPDMRCNKQIGAHYITRIARQHPELRVLDSELIYPAHWSDVGSGKTPDISAAYTVHHWHNKQRDHGFRDGGGGGVLMSAVAPPPELYGLRTLSRAESLETLYALAARVPADEAIVEIGTYRGASAVWLAAGAQSGLGAHVWTIDPHDLPGHRTTTGRRPGSMKFEDPRIRWDAERQIATSGYGDHITMIRDFSVQAATRWDGPNVGFLFIDGDHREGAVRRDLRSWQPHLSEFAAIAFDDYADSHPGVPNAIRALRDRGVLGPIRRHGRIGITATVPPRERAL